MDKPVLREAGKIGRADGPISIEMDSHLFVPRLQSQRAILELAHTVFVNFDVPIERGLVAALEEIDVHELIFGMQAMSHEDGHFTTEPAASETNPVVSSIQQLQFETAAMTSDVQSRLVIGIVFGELDGTCDLESEAPR